MINLFIFIILFGNSLVPFRCDLLDDPNRKLALMCSIEKYEKQKSEGNRIILICKVEKNDQKEGFSRATKKPNTQLSKTTNDGITNTKKNSINFDDTIKSFLSEPVKNVPKNAESLKSIGDYCVKTRTKETNCAKMLDLLKQKFQACQQISKDNDNECISFKKVFCTAFKDFPCCFDVLNGQPCVRIPPKQLK